MGKPHPIELRERVVAHVDEGHSHRGAARHFRVSPKFVNDMINLRRETVGLEPKRQGSPGHGKLRDLGGWVQARLSEKGELTLAELRDEIKAAHDLKVHRSAVGKWLHRLGLSHKKTLQAGEQERPDVAHKRRVWTVFRRPAMRNALERLVFIDETSLKTNLVKTTGWAPRGQRLVDHAPFGHWNTQTFIAGLRVDRLTAPWVIPGAMNRIAFDTYIATQLAPTLNRGDIVIADNLSAHKSDTAARHLRELGCHLIFLPPYSPDMNPIEMAFAKIKTLVRKAAARTFDDLWKAVGQVCDLFPEQQCSNFFKAAGYETN